MGDGAFRLAAQAAATSLPLVFRSETLNRSLPQFAPATSVELICETLARCIVAHVVGNRQDRYEPRVRKRRPKEYDLMNKPRAEYKRQAA